MSTTRPRRGLRRAARFVVLLGALAAGGAGAGRDDRDEVPLEPPPPPETAEQFLAEVELLITAEERAAFLALAEPYQRTQFIRRFWAVRDPFPQTAVNELEQRWRAQHAEAGRRFAEPGDERRLVFTVLGPPEGTQRLACLDWLLPLEAWRYSGAPGLPGGGVFVFYQPRGLLRGAYRSFAPADGLRAVVDWSATVSMSDQQVLEAVAGDCAQGGIILAQLSRAIDPRALLASPQLVPRPSPEWLSSFVAYGTEVPADAPALVAELTLRFPGRHQSRTVVQGVLEVVAASAAASSGPQPTRVFVVDGEVLRQGELFEQFRYRFSVPATVRARPEGTTGEEPPVPLVFERRLRPGDYRLLLRVHDTVGERYFRAEVDLAVPVVEPGTRLPVIAVSSGSSAGAPSTGTAPASAAAAARLVEADATLASGDWGVELRVPRRELLLGKARVEARTAGEGIAEVRFSLDGRPVMSKRAPPFSVELDLGARAAIHTVVAEARDAAGKVLASDEVLLNSGAQRFGLRLLSPEPGGRYVGSLRAQAEVDVPEGETLERLELYLEETLVATLYQAPFVQPILLPEGAPLTYVRAVAFLADGRSAERTVLINAPGMSEELEVRVVELYTTFFDRRERPVEDVARDEVTVLEDDEPQPIQRFERVEDRPLRVALVLDTSASMAERLDAVEKGALRFVEQVVGEGDRAAVVAFADQPRLAARLTGDHGVLAGGLAGLTAEGETALWDSLVFTLHYFGGLSGRRAVVVLTDGEDVSSRHAFEEVVEYARHLEIPIYAIGIDLSSRAHRARSLLVQLAEETGGRASFIANASGLAKIYDTIEEELRAQVLIAYQAKTVADRERYRKVEVKVARPGVEARTLRGYYP